MKILWITNTLFPDIANAINVKIPVVGGWMYSGAINLKKIDESLTFAILTPYNGDRVKKYVINDFIYYLIPNTKNNNKYNSLTNTLIYHINQEFKPDIVHIHGTEYSFSLAYINVCGAKNVVVSIQGLVSIYSRYYLGGLSKTQIRPTLRDIFRKDWLTLQQNKMAKRGENEIKILKKVNHIIGRTTWDLANTWAINPKAKYHFCNETLRRTFYNKKWKYSGCEPYSIFVSQAYYPIKGLHQLIKALPLVKRHFPSVHVYVAGNDYFRVKKFRKNGFIRYLDNLIRQYSLENNITFLGVLNEEEMASHYEKANIFVCPSTIENSSNSIGEAQLIGTPCIASYVGGSMDMINDGETGFLYRFEETSLLAYRICQLFEDDLLCASISEKERNVAYERHNQERNANNLLTIYKSIINYD